MIVVRHLDGHPAYLSEAAVAVFEAERLRERNELAWDAARVRWLSLAAAVHAPEARAVRIAGRPPSEAAVAAARTLYTGAAERVAREAKRAKRWDSVAKIRDEQSAVLYADAGSPVPPPDELVALYRDGRSAVLRSLAAVTSYAELVAAGCCRPCREDDGKAFRIATELREPRLPHAGCPRGLCGCDWWMTVGVEEPVRKRRAASARTAPRGHAADGEQTPEAGPPTPPSPPT